MTKKHAAAIYARFSSHNQRDASIEDQVRACREDAERRGDTVVAVYADRAKSGTTTAGRDEFSRMMEESAEGKFSTLYVYKLDRFARNRYDSAVSRKRLRERGVEVRPVAESVPDGPEGIILETLLEGLAEYYSANLSQNVRRGMDGNARKCMHNGARLYGYDLGDDGYYHVNEDEATVVRLMFDLYAKGRSVPEIVRALDPYRTRTGKRFGNSHVTRMLRNEKYAGTYVYRDVRVPGGMEAIVDMDLFRAVNDELGTRARRRQHKSRERYLLTGRLFDEYGRPYVGVSGTARDGSKRCYYKCIESGVSWRKDDVEDAMRWAVAKMLQATPETCEEIARMAADAAEDEGRTDGERLESVRRRLAEIEREANNVVDAIAKGMPAERLMGKLEALDAEKVALESEMASLEHAAMPNMYELALFFLEQLRACEMDASVAEPFVSRMEVDREGNVYVEFSLMGRTPVTEAAGVRISCKWLGECNRMRTVRIAAKVHAWATGTSIVIMWLECLERPKRGRHW